MASCSRTECSIEWFPLPYFSQVAKTGRPDLVKPLLSVPKSFLKLLRGMKTKLRVGLQAAVVILAVTWVYSPAFHGAKLWDDTSDFPETRLAFNLSGLAKVWTGAFSYDYYPLKRTVEWIQWLLWGEDTLGAHLTNVGLHVLSALLFWRLLGRLGVRWAWFGGLLLAVHPLAVESVAWMSEIKNTLSLPFLLLAMIAFISYDEKKSAGQLVLALLCFLASLLCKSSVVMFPVVLLLYCWWKRGRICLADVWASSAFFVISLVLGLVEMGYQHLGLGGGSLNIGGFFSRLAGAGLAIAFYLWKFIAPIGLMPIYPRWTVVPPSPAQFLPWLALGALVGWFWTKRAEWGRDALFGLGCFGINLLPVLGLIPMTYLLISWVADHFVYLPMLGLIGLVAGGAGTLADRLTSQRRALLAASAAIVLCALGFASHRYATTFSTVEAFWDNAVRQNPQAWVAQNNLACAIAGQPARKADTLAHYEAALRLNPDYAEAHNNLAIFLAGQPGRQADAIAHYETALRLKPDYAEAHSNLAYLLANQTGRQMDAIAQYKAALRIEPDYVAAQYALANLLASQPVWQADAIAHYETTLRLKPDYAEAHNNLAILLAKQPGRQAEAIAHYETALRLKPDDAGTHYNLAYLLASLPGREDEAALQFRAALKINPDFAAAREALQRLQANNR
jgi:tetratricopeptide (TPR) repeat protein